MCAGIDGFVCMICAAVDVVMDTLTACQHCRMRQRVIRLICDGNEPAGTAGVIVNMLCDRAPRAVAKWLTHNPELIIELRRAATGEQALSHERFDQLGGTPSVEHFRRRLIEAALLPQRHHQLALFDQWTTRLLESIRTTSHHQTVATYATWQVRRRLAGAVDNNTLRTASTRAARGRIRVAVNFLQWLDNRGVTLADCTQRDLDQWFATGNTHRVAAVGFITWARTQRLCNRHLRVPAYQSGTPTAMPHSERVELVRRLLTDTTITLADRVAGLLVAVYAQPVTRVCRLRCEAFTINDDSVALHVGPQDIELAAPVANAVQQLLDDPDRRHSPWLFPGLTAGQPRSSHSLGERLRIHGVTKAARVAAFHNLVQDIPSPVLADLIGYNTIVIARRADTLAGPWNHYAALRTSTPSEPR